MLSKAQMVAVRKAVEMTYDATCTVTEYCEIIKPNKSTVHEEVVVLENQPCKLSFKNNEPVRQSETGAAQQQNVKLIIAPELIINPGSKITVSNKERTVDYINSGVPAVYDSHQEITLDMFGEWA